MKIIAHFLLVALCLFIFNASISAQSYTGINFRVDKAHSPLFIADKDAYHLDNTNTVAGLSLFAEFQINDRFSLIPELTYSRRVAHYSKTDSIADHYKQSNSSYLQIPLLLKTNFKFESFQFFLIGGPYFELALKMENREGAFVKGTPINGLENNLIKRHDIGFSIGTGIEKKIARNVKTVLQIRYAHGFRDLDPDPENQFYNNGFSLLVGLSTPIKM